MHSTATKPGTEHLTAHAQGLQGKDTFRSNGVAGNDVTQEGSINEVRRRRGWNPDSLTLPDIVAAQMTLQWLFAYSMQQVNLVF